MCWAQFIMRYFNLKQHTEPIEMFKGERKADISVIEKIGKEITEEQAKVKPQWGSGNISVDETGKWKWEADNHDSSG